MGKIPDRVTEAAPEGKQTHGRVAPSRLPGLPQEPTQASQSTRVSGSGPCPVSPVLSHIRVLLPQWRNSRSGPAAFGFPFLLHRHSSFDLRGGGQSPESRGQSPESRAGTRRCFREEKPPASPPPWPSALRLSGPPPHSAPPHYGQREASN